VLVPLQRFAGLHRHARAAERLDETIEAINDQRWVRFASGPEVRLDPEVDLDAVRLEPAAPALGEMFGLRNSRNSQQRLVEDGGTRLFARRHGQLDVVEGANAHRPILAPLAMGARTRPSALSDARSLRPTLELTDPRTLRGLAHPVRLALIGLLRREGPLTATEAGAHLGLSPASCSFHLRQLAKYGLVVEAGGGRGRRRPWRATARTTSWPAVAADPEQVAAATQLSTVLAERYFEEAVAYLRRRDTETVEWQRAAMFGDAILYVTAGEMAEIGEQVEAVLARYSERTHDAGLRPHGARHVTFIRLAFPEADATVAPTRHER
jgi:DNA-binding transcriptional ArsR family regulator